MAAWDDLRLTLARLVEERPGALTRSPNLDGDGETPPYPVGLAPWAEVLARELHERFGDQVHLTVGALAPDGMAAAQQWLVRTWDTALAAYAAEVSRRRREPPAPHAKSSERRSHP
jgi:hypothetical protein